MDKPLKLNIKRTCVIGFAFFGILLLWQVYDSWCPTFLTELFMGAFPGKSNEEVQYLVGIMMAIDNLAALILLPIPESTKLSLSVKGSRATPTTSAPNSWSQIESQEPLKPV